MIERMNRGAEASGFERFTPVRLTRAALERMRKDLDMKDASYVIYWRNGPDEYRPQATLLVSEPVDGAVMDALKRAASENEVQQILVRAGHACYYVDENEVVVDPGVVH